MKKLTFSMLVMALFAITPLLAQDANKILETYFETIGQDKL